MQNSGGAGDCPAPAGPGRLNPVFTSTRQGCLDIFVGACHMQGPSDNPGWKITTTAHFHTPHQPPPRPTSFYWVSGRDPTSERGFPAGTVIWNTHRAEAPLQAGAGEGRLPGLKAPGFWQPGPTPGLTPGACHPHPPSRKWGRVGHEGRTEARTSFSKCMGSWGHSFRAEVGEGPGGLRTASEPSETGGSPVGL